ncbi:MAG: response regulator transcription factor [Bacteroidota bacterium]
MKSERPTVLVVDDEPKLIGLVREVLTATGFKVFSATRGGQAIELVATEQPDLLLLDIVLADDIDGYEVARRVREFSDLPIVMLTAKARQSEILRGFDVGADDYLTKPFSSKELVARVRAVLKRTREVMGEVTDSPVLCGSLEIDLARHRVLRHGEEVHLTRTEFSLLRELATHRNKVLTHEQLLSAVWGNEYLNDLEYLRAYVRYLRRKLEPTPSDPRLITTVQGVGYMLECQDREA